MKTITKWILGLGTVITGSLIAFKLLKKEPYIPPPPSGFTKVWESIALKISKWDGFPYDYHTNYVLNTGEVTSNAVRLLSLTTTPIYYNYIRLFTSTGQTFTHYIQAEVSNINPIIYNFPAHTNIISIEIDATVNKFPNYSTGKLELGYVQ